MASKALTSHSDTLANGPTVSPERPSSVRRLKLDLLEDQRFSFSEPDSLTHNPTRSSSPIRRYHWQHPSSHTRCNAPGCDKLLGVRNGMTNCRKCGRLFCADHCTATIRLINGQNLPQHSQSMHGHWCRCCSQCYAEKPDVRAAFQAGIKDVTFDFKALRTKHAESACLARSQTRNRFIQLATQLETQSASHLSVNRWWPARLEWDNNDLTNCQICFTKFTLLLRKHHCRLCKRLVCDDPVGDRKYCSIMVPIGVLISKLPDLAYSEPVRRRRWLLALPINSPSFRCCVVCKKNLLFEKRQIPADPHVEQYVSAHNNLLQLRDQLNSLMLKYAAAVHHKLDSVPKLSSRAASLLKAFEAAILHFRTEFIATPVAEHRQAIANTYRAHVENLQESLARFKVLVQEYQANQRQALENAQLTLGVTPLEDTQLTKKQIRELREQLMVMNEQKYLIETMITDYTRQRKFNETVSLRENAQELQREIEKLTSELGEYGF